MIPLQLAQIAGLTGGALQGPDVLVDGPVVTDSRQAGAGGLYVARIGEHDDGHRFVPDALDHGAVAVLGLHRVGDAPTVVVPDVQDAFAALARGVVDRAPHLTIIGITGSSGKTSTKDMLAHVLEGTGETVAPVGSLNSEVGVPLTVCRITGSTRYLVAEMGADGVGHIAYLTTIAPPRIGIVLNVGTAHVGKFGSVQAIADTKAALVEALPSDGLAILNADDQRVAAMATRTRARVVTVGEGGQIRSSRAELDAMGRPTFTLEGLGEPLRIHLGLHGAHQVGNALAVAAAAHELGIPPATIAERLESARAVSRWRMEVHALPSGITLINDAYNANPDSMTAALRSLAQMAGGRRSVAVLGEMLELGEMSPSAHDRIGRALSDLGIDVLIAVGDGAAMLAEGARAVGGVEVHQVDDVDAAHDLLSVTTREDDVILLKSSRDSGLRYLGDRLVAESGAEVTS